MPIAKTLAKTSANNPAKRSAGTPAKTPAKVPAKIARQGKSSATLPAKAVSKAKAKAPSPPEAEMPQRSSAGTKSSAATSSRVALPGSNRLPYPTAGNPKSVAGLHAAAAPASRRNARFTVSVLLCARTPLDLSALAKPGTPRLTRPALARLHGPSPASVKLLRAFAAEFGLTLAPTAGPRLFQLTGTPSAMSKAFGVTLHHRTDAGRALRLREGEIFLPANLTGHIDAVLGLDNRPQATPHFRIARPHATNVSYTPVEVAQLYSFPAKPSAAGQTIGLIELGGGFRPADLTAYFASLNLPAPKVTAVSVDKAKNTPGDADGADGEVMLDIEVAAAVAPGVDLAVYFAPNTDAGFLDAITAAVHDTANKPSVISISWGGPESSWTAGAMTAMDAACQAAAALGITITVACGDNGATDGVSDGANHVDFPASSPHVLACGGTKLTASDGAIADETVWNELSIGEGATGGGVSTFFPLPSWQSGSNVPAPTVSDGGRGLPDVAGDADPSTGYTVRVDGQTAVIGGTSAVAPLWAGLIALANAANKSPAGFLNPTLYAAPSATFHDITTGTNGAFDAAPGWDPCTGLGSPIGTAVIAALGSGTSMGSGKKGTGGKGTGKGGKKPVKKK